ncbi:MAG: FMN-binding negative transcriptional regulator [Rhizobiaceae bacterium]
MYQPPHFIETDRDVLHALIRAHPLGLLISATPDGPVADPVPMLLDADEGQHGRLRAHVARANAHWKIIRDTPEMPVLVVFQGADSYVTPSWYETKRETGKVVPTWNYATVQVRGKARAIEDTAWIGQQIRELTGKHEASRVEPWAVEDAPERYIEAQLRGIVGIEIDIGEIHGKWKVSQNRPEADRVGVAEGLAGIEGAAEMTALVRRYGKLG